MARMKKKNKPPQKNFDQIVAGVLNDKERLRATAKAACKLAQVFIVNNHTGKKYSLADNIKFRHRKSLMLGRTLSSQGVKEVEKTIGICNACTVPEKDRHCNYDKELRNAIFEFKNYLGNGETGE